MDEKLKTAQQIASTILNRFDKSLSKGESYTDSDEYKNIIKYVSADDKFIPDNPEYDKDFYINKITNILLKPDNEFILVFAGKNMCCLPSNDCCFTNDIYELIEEDVKSSSLEDLITRMECNEDFLLNFYENLADEGLIPRNSEFGFDEDSGELIEEYSFIEKKFAEIITDDLLAKFKDAFIEELKNDYTYQEDAEINERDFCNEYLKSIDFFKNHDFIIMGSEMGWRNLSGYKATQAEDFNDILEAVTGDYDFTANFNYNTWENILSARISTHDSPTGEFYTIIPADNITYLDRYNPQLFNDVLKLSLYDDDVREMMNSTDEIYEKYINFISKLEMNEIIKNWDHFTYDTYDDICIYNENKLPEQFILEHLREFDENAIVASGKYSDEFLEQLDLDVDWSTVSEKWNLKEDVIEKYRDNLYWYYFSHQDFSIDFMKKHVDYIRWDQHHRLENIDKELAGMIESRIDWAAFYEYHSENEITKNFMSKLSNDSLNKLSKCMKSDKITEAVNEIISSRISQNSGMRSR